MPARIPLRIEDEIIRCYLDGLTIKEVAEVVGYSDSACRLVLDRRNVLIRPRAGHMAREQVDIAIELYASGMSAEAIGGRFGTSGVTVCKRLRQRGVTIRPPHTYIPDSSRATMVDFHPMALEWKTAYEGGESGQDIARRCGVSGSCVYRWLEEFGVKLRTPEEAHRSYDCNRSYFQTITTEEQAYWLGFLAADGNVKNDQVVLRLAVADRDHVEAFNRAIGSTYPLHEYDQPERFYKKWKRGRYAGVYISCRQMAEDLARHGLLPNKVHRVSPWKGRRELLRHWWRGVWDGDGSLPLTKRKEGGTRWQLNLVGTRAVCQGFSDFLFERTGFRGGVYQHKMIWAFHAGSLAANKAVAKLLYDGSTVHLVRKFEKAQMLLHQPLNRSRKKGKGQAPLA